MAKLASGTVRQARFFCACAFTASLLVEPIACSRSDDMQSYGQKAPASSGKSPVSAVPSRVNDLEQEAVSAIRSKNSDAAAPAVFKYLRSDSPLEKQLAVLNEFAKKFGDAETQDQVFKFLKKDHCKKEEKFRVVDIFLLKYGLNAMVAFYYHAQLDLGTDFSTSKKKMAEEHPETLSYIQAVAYGISRFGAKGFFVADALLETMDKFRIFRLPLVSNEDNPLTGVTAMMAIERMAADRTINPEKSIAHLSEKYLLLKEAPDPKLKLALPDQEGKYDPYIMGTVISIINILDRYGPNDGTSALEELLQNPRLDPVAKDLIEKKLKR